MLVTFLLEKDVNVAAQEVRDRVNQIVSELPDDADAPVVEKLDPDATPILNIALAANRPVREITEYADKVLRRQLESVPGVGHVRIVGGRKRQINVRLDPVRLKAFALTALDVQRALRTENVQIPAGIVKNTASEAGLRVLGKALSVDALGRIVVSERDGGLVRLNAVAQVEDGEQEPRSAARRNGIPTVLLSLRKQSGENTIAVVDAVNERLEENLRLLPEGYSVEIVRDNSKVIRTSVHAVKEHLVLGALFAALTVLVFLGNSRATLITALAIPTSILAAFGVMWVQDVTINQISLVALALAVGIVIDDTIIVVENIFRHMEEKGESAFDASISGTRDIGLPVLATTLSLLAVFIPVAFLGGIVGMFLKSFGLTMAFAIAVSLLVSFSLAPALAAKLFHHHEKPGAWDTAMERFVNLGYRPVERLYMVLLRHSLHHRWVVVLACLIVFGSLPVLMKTVKKDFLPPVEEAEFVVSLRAPEGSTLAATDLIAERVARDIRRLSGVESTLLTIGDTQQQTPNFAEIFVRLTAPDLRPDTQETLMDRVRRDIVPKYPEQWRITVLSVPPFNSGMSSANIQYFIAGPDLDLLTKATDAVMQEARAIPGIRDLDSTLIAGKPEITARVDRSKAGQLGIRAADISTTLRVLLGGVDVSTYDEGGERYNIHLRAAESHRNSREALSLLAVPSARVGPVTLDNMVQLEPGDGPSQINRLNRRRQVTFTANNAPGFGETQILEALEEAVKKANLPPEYESGTTGRTKEMRKAGIAFATAFLLAFIFMYLILAAVFESWLHPATILLALPLSLPFAILSLILFGQSINIFSMLANKERLRPILMTTLAFVAGMIPMMLARGVGAAYNNPSPPMWRSSISCFAHSTRSLKPFGARSNCTKPRSS